MGVRKTKAATPNRYQRIACTWSQLGKALGATAAAATALVALGMASLPARSIDPPEECPDFGGGNGGNLQTTCGDANGDGSADYRDYPFYWEAAKLCPNFPNPITPETIIDTLNRIPEACPADPGPCAGIAAGAALVFQGEFGRMPTPDELGELDGGGICQPPISVPELPGGPGPFWCASADPNMCKPGLIEPPGQDCDDPECIDVPICAGIDCTLPGPLTDIPLPTPGNLVPFPQPKPDDGDPAWGPRWYPPGMEPKDEPEQPSPPPSAISATTPSDSSTNESEAESSSKDDDEPKDKDEKEDKNKDDSSKDGKKKDCGSDSSGAAGGQGGSSAVSSAPVTLAWGQKSEIATDVSVRLTGGDFVIERSYTSDLAFEGPHLVGNNWSLSCFSIMSAPQPDRLHVYSRDPNRVCQFVSDGNGGWSATGPGRQRISKTEITTSLGATPVWKLTEPGAGARFYFRARDNGEFGLHPNPSLIGLLVREEDPYGNANVYGYDLFGPSGDKKARLRSIALNFDGTSAEAEIRFEWYLVVGSEGLNHPLNGKLARMRVIRFVDEMARETDRVEYTYKHYGDPFSADVGQDGDLIQVTRFARVDAWAYDGNPYAPSYPHRLFVTQYRYHGNSHSSSDPRLAVSGAPRQLKSIFQPEQVEYYAQKLHRTGVLEHPSLAVRDAAYRLMLLGDGALAFTDESSNPFKVVDVAAKVIGYDSESRVGVEFLQSACGCSGGVTQGLRQTFTYYTWTSNTLWPRGGQGTKIEEHTFDGSGYNTLHRTRFYDMAAHGTPNVNDPASFVPYLVNSVVEDVGGNRWVWHYEYSSAHQVAQKYTPAAISSYTPASGGSAPDYTKASTGLIFEYAYTAERRLTSMKVRDGVNGSPEEITRITYPNMDDVNVRTYLPRQVEQFVEAGTSDEDKIQTTWFEYGFHGNSTTSRMLAWRRVIAEREKPAENGPETSDSGVVLFTPPGGQGGVVVADSYELFDTGGRLCWVRHPDWSLTWRQFTAGSVRPTTITYNADRTNIDTNVWSLSTSGWGYADGGTTRLSGGTLTEEFEYDEQGRVTIMRGPGGVERRFVRESRPLGFDQIGELPGVYFYVKTELPHRITTSPDTYSGPAVMNWITAGGRVVCGAEFELDTSGGLVSTPVARRTMQYLLAGQLNRERVWHNIEQGAFYDTTYTYDALGRLDTVTHPTGTVVKHDAYDVMGRVLQVSMGKVGSSTVPVQAFFYDDPDTDDTPEQGIGNGNLSWTVRYAGEDRTSGDSGNPSAEVRTFRVFDFRNRLKVAKGPEAPHFAASYDNLGRRRETGLYGAVPSFTFTGTIPATDRGVYVKYGYSQRGERYATLIATNPTSPTAFLGTYSWFDSAGRPLATWEPNSPRTKMRYDGLGRPSTVWIADGAGDPSPGAQNNYSSAVSVTDDVVLEQIDHRYDSHGRGDLVTARVRIHDGTGTGALTDSNSVVTYDGAYFDGADRPIRHVEFGTNQAGFTAGGPSPASSWPPSSPPNWNDANEQRLVTTIAYNAKGQAEIVTDPEGRRTKSGFDAMGRVVWTIENESNGGVTWSGTLGRWTASGMSSTDPSLNRVTSYVYTFDSSGDLHIRQFAHHLDSGNSETVQVTQYEFGTTAGSSSNDLDSLVGGGHLLARIRYPHPDTGAPGGDAQSALYAYDRQGEIRGFRDQNGTVHRFDRDMRARVIKDRVTAFGSDTSIDTRVTAIGNRYDRLGRLDRTQSFQGTTVVNAAEFTYNALGQIARVYQDADGPVSTGTKFVEYSYEASATGNYARMAELAYPKDAALTFDFGSGTDSRISRVRAISLSNLSKSIKELATYEYLGMGFHAGVDLPLIDVQLDRTAGQDGKRRIRGHTSQTQGVYPGWDRFGREVHHAWVDGTLAADTGGLPTRPPIIEDVLGYDRAGVRLSTYDRRPGADRADRDSEYDYDGLKRLKESNRGKRVDQAMWTFGKESQSWDLDMLGNWTQVRTDLSGDGQYTGNYETEARTHDELNQMVSKQLTSPPSEPVRPLAYDSNGNLKSHQKSVGITVKYSHDAWGRLTLIKHLLANNTLRDVAEYQYNGLHWRTLKKVDTDGNGSLDQTRRAYYSAAWQLLEEDVSGGETVQYFWGLRYVDDILMHRRFTQGPEDDASTYFHLTDIQFSTVAILDDTGKLLERTRYQAYGQGSFRWPGDFNRDGDVDDLDYDEIKAAVQQEYVLGDAGYEPDLDLDRDGKITDDDFTLFDAWYGKSKAGLGLISDPAGPDSRVGYAGYVFNPEALIYTVRHRHYDPMLGRFMSTDWLGYADGMNLYEYVGGRAMNFNDPSGLAWYNPLTWGLGGADESDIQATKDKYCQSQKDQFDQGKMCKDEFEKRWKNGGCGQSVSSEISDAAITGFGQGAYDGYIQTSHSAVNAMTFGLLDAIAPLSDDDFYDPDNPYLVVSDIAGTIAGEALMIVLTGGGKNVCINVCFAEGTLVTTDDGLKPIEDIRPGDRVWSFDEATGCATLSRVVRTFESTADELVEVAIAGETICVTPEHPFWVDGLGWTPARDLRAGAPVLTRDGGVAAAVLVRPIPGPARVFNLEVAGTHTYFVSSDGIAVHNACVWSFIKNTVFRVEKNAFKYPKKTGLNVDRWHFHLGPGKELMKHHLPHEWRGWIGNLKTIIKRRWR